LPISGIHSAISVALFKHRGQQEGIFTIGLGSKEGTDDDDEEEDDKEDDNDDDKEDDEEEEEDDE
jgi:hypothetical protein